MKKNKSNIFILAFVILFLGTAIFARTQKYDPGATINPDCAPGESNCSVDTGKLGKFSDNGSGKIYYNGGNVGLGISDPARKLDVTGDINFTGDLYQNGVLFSTSASLWTDGGATSYLTQTDDKIGIGTTIATHKLDVRGPVRIDNSGSYDLWLQGGSATSGNDRNLAILGVKSSDELRLNYGGEYTGGTRFDGNVGIGISSPSEKLEVAGNIKVGTGNYFWSKANDTQYVIKTTRTDDSQPGYLKSNGWGSFSFNKGLAVGYDWSEAVHNGMIINGNVGIGTSSPTEKLVVNGGNIKVDAANRKIGYWGSDEAHNGYLMPYDSNGFVNIVSSFATGGILFKTKNNERVKIDSNGNVGIGTTSPAGKLDVDGSICIQGDCKNSWAEVASGGAGKFVDGDDSNDAVYTTGNVGIGTTAPNAKLQVVGKITSASTSSSDSNNTVTTKDYVDAKVTTGAGASAINELTDAKTGGYSVFLGADAGANDDGSSNYNVGVGNYALNLNTTGERNTAVGMHAGRYTNSGGSNQTSNNSLYLGYNSRALNNGDTNEIVIGSEARGHGSNTATIGSSNITDNYFNGNIRFTGNIYKNGSEISGGKFVDGDDSNDAVYTTGNVGVGTTTPESKLHLTFSSTNTGGLGSELDGLIIQNSDGNTGSPVSIIFSSDSAGRGKTAISHVDTGNYGVGDLYFALDDDAHDSRVDISTDTKMVIKNSGNVGIGTTSPSEQFHTTGTARFDGGIQVDGKTMIRDDGYFHTAQSTVDDHYGYFEGRKDDGTRGFYIGFGNGGTDVYMTTDNANKWVMNQKLYVGGDLQAAGGIRARNFETDSGEQRCPAGQVMVGFNTSGLICEETSGATYE